MILDIIKFACTGFVPWITTVVIFGIIAGAIANFRFINVDINNGEIEKDCNCDDYEHYGFEETSKKEEEDNN